jgi:hypothetical protein
MFLDICWSYCAGLAETSCIFSWSSSKEFLFTIFHFWTLHFTTLNCFIHISRTANHAKQAAPSTEWLSDGSVTSSGQTLANKFLAAQSKSKLDSLYNTWQFGCVPSFSLIKCLACRIMSCIISELCLRTLSLFSKSVNYLPWCLHLEFFSLLNAMLLQNP